MKTESLKSGAADSATQLRDSSRRSDEPRAKDKASAQETSDTDATHEEDVRRFQMALSQRNPRDDSQFGQGGQGQAPLLSANVHPEKSQGASLTGIASPTPGGGSVQTELVQLVSKLSDQLWVKDPSGAQPREVRMSMRNDVLPDTQLRVSRVDQMLLIQIGTLSAASYQQLTLSRQQLLGSLQKKYGADKVSVQIGFSDDPEQFEGGDFIPTIHSEGTPDDSATP